MRRRLVLGLLIPLACGCTTVRMPDGSPERFRPISKMVNTAANSMFPYCISCRGKNSITVPYNGVVSGRSTGFRGQEPLVKGSD